MSIPHSNDELILAEVLKRWDIDTTTGRITNIRSGKEAKGVTTYGYIQCHCGFLGKRRLMLRGHQMVFLKEHGYIPDNIDHEDRNKLNNASYNLRDATPVEQARNKGQDGVVYRTDQKVYRARIRLRKGKQLERTFKTYDEALAWRQRKEQELWQDR